MWKTLKASDDHSFEVYVAEPTGEPQGAVVVLQEIFGVNAHIRSVCDRLAQEGYKAFAPSLFDRVKPNHEADYTSEGKSASLELLMQYDVEDGVLDIDATIAEASSSGPVSVIGFCLGGSLAYRVATTNTQLVACVSYYGALVAEFASRPPLCPVILHYGAQDTSIPAENVQTVKAKQPDIPVYMYDAGHGFNCDVRAAYHESSAKKAWARTMELLEQASKASPQR